MSSHESPSLLPSPHPTKSFWQQSDPFGIAEHRSTEGLPASVDAVIIGSGISGAFAARKLSMISDYRIAVLEARNLCSAATGRVC